MFRYNGDNEKIKMAVNVANDYELLNHIYSEILHSNGYDMTVAPATYIANKYYEFMRLCDIEIEVYYPRYRWSKAIGYFTPSKPRTIHINGYKDLSIESMVSNFYHESGHSFDASVENYSISHGDNSPTGKENTFQYSLNRYVYEFLNYEPVKIVKASLISRIINFLKWW